MRRKLTHQVILVSSGGRVPVAIFGTAAMKRLVSEGRNEVKLIAREQTVAPVVSLTHTPNFRI
jgi:hypothetical protein